MSDRPLIDYSLAVFNFSGLVVPSKNDARSKMKQFTLLFFVVTSYVDVIFCNIFKHDDPDAMENVFVLFSLTQILLKIVMALLQIENIFNIINDMESFWPIRKFGLEQEKVNMRVFSFVKTNIKILMVCLASVVVGFALRPVFEAKKRLPYTTYFLKTSNLPFYAIGYVYQILVVTCLVVGPFGFDVAFLSLITNIICELKLLQAGFTQIRIEVQSKTEKQTMDRLKTLIRHHNVILDCSKFLRNIFYVPFLCIFLLNMFGIGLSLLCIIIQRAKNIELCLVYGMCGLIFVLQLFMYCAPGTVLISESTRVADAIFNTDWWIKTQPELRRTYVMIIQRANKAEMLSAGGMMNVTLEGFNTIMKSAFSFFTFANAMYKDT